MAEQLGLPDDLGPRDKVSERLEQDFKTTTVRQIDEAKKGGVAKLKESFLGIFARAKIALDHIKQRVKDRISGKDSNALKKSLTGDINDPKSEKHTVILTQIHVREILKAYKSEPALIPETVDAAGAEIIRQLAAEVDDPDHLSDAICPYVYRLMHQSITQVVDPLSILEPEELQHLIHLDSELGQKIVGILKKAAMKKNIPQADIDEWHKQIMGQKTIAPEPKDTKLRQEQPGIPDSEKSEEEGETIPIPDSLSEYGSIPATFSYQARDYASIFRRHPDLESQETLLALLDAKRLDIYFGRRLKEMAPNYDELTPLEQDQVSREISEQFKERIQLMVGKLFQEVDESAPEESWEEAAKVGSPFETTESQYQAFLKQLTNLRLQLQDLSIYPNIRKLKFFRKVGLEEDARVPVRPAFKKLAEGERYEELDRYITAFYNDEEVTVGEYFLTLHNSAKDEIAIRKFLHNVTALQYQPEPVKGGYYSQLALYAEHLLPASAIDVIATLPDRDVAYSASRFEDKLLEADYAMFNWIHKPTLSTLDPETKMTERNACTIEYLRKLFPGLAASDEFGWRIRRALAMGVGDNHSIALKALEHGARADPPRDLKNAYSSDFASYDKKDHKAFMAFNPFNHYNMRYSMDKTLIGNLVFLPVEGDIRQSLTAFWDHNSVIRTMQQMRNSWVTGRDTDKHQMLIDYTNIGRTGSIFTRTGDINSHRSWRKIHSYEGYLVRQRDPDGRLSLDHDIVRTWKNIENIGTEVLIDYLSRIGTLNQTFYRPEGVAQRRELVDHIYRRYFRNPGQNQQDVNQADISRRFNELERHSGDPEELEGAYKEFYYQAVVRAMRQRIPTKFIRYERNREVVNRQRAWEVVRRDYAGNMSDSIYRQAVRDLIAAEVRERNEATTQIRRAVDKQRVNGHLSRDALHRLHEEHIDYELTESKVRRYLQEMNIPEDRVNNAVTVLRGIYRFTDEIDGGQYLNKFAKKYENNIFPFAMGVEELERTLLAQRASGERTPARVFDDIANTEEKVSKVFIKYWEQLHDVASNGKKDFSPLIHTIEQAKNQLEEDIGPDYAEKFAHHMAAVTIAYFKKDTVGRNLVTRALLMGTNRKYSIAAEFGGTYRGVWEWNVNDIANFINTLEVRNILPKEPYEVGKPPEYKKKNVEFWNPLTGKQTKLPFKSWQRVHEREWYGAKLRQEFGATNWHIALEYMNKAVPIIMVVVLYHWIKDALSESQGKES